MREAFKRRLAVMLSVLFVLPTVLTLLPTASLEAQAASVTGMGWSFYSSEAVQIEEGQSFYVGDLVNVYYGSSPTQTASMVKASYSSSSKKVATVNSKGYLEALAAGTTTIKVTFKGKKVTKEFEVVEKGTFKQTTAVKKLTEAAGKLPASTPSSVTVKNGFDLAAKYQAYRRVAQKYQNNVDENGFIKEKQKSGSYTYYSSTSKLAVPQASRSKTLSSLMWVYAKKNDPTSTRSSKVLKISSVTGSAKSGTFSFSFTNKVTREQALAAKLSNALYGNNTAYDKLSDSEAYVQCTVKNGGKSYEGYLVIKANSNKGTMKLYTSKYNSSKGSYTYKSAKIKAGSTYVIGYATEWTKGKSVTAAK